MYLRGLGLAQRFTVARAEKEQSQCQPRVVLATMAFLRTDCLPSHHCRYLRTLDHMIKVFGLSSQASHTESSFTIKANRVACT